MENETLPMNIKFQMVGYISVSSHDIRSAAENDDRITTPMNIMDILFRQGRTCPLQE